MNAGRAGKQFSGVGAGRARGSGAGAGQGSEQFELFVGSGKRSKKV